MSQHDGETMQHVVPNNVQAFGQAFKLPIGNNIVVRQPLAHNNFPTRIESLTDRRHSNLYCLTSVLLSV